MFIIQLKKYMNYKIDTEGLSVIYTTKTEIYKNIRKV